MSKQIDIHSLFFHGQHIDDPKWFAGRKYDIERALKSLCSPPPLLVFHLLKTCTTKRNCTKLAVAVSYDQQHINIVIELIAHPLLPGAFMVGCWHRCSPIEHRYKFLKILNCVFSILPFDLLL